MSAVRQTATLQRLVPLLVAEDHAASVAFYAERLGFRVMHTWDPDGKLAWCQIEREGAALMLQQACPGEDHLSPGRAEGVWFYFNCDDVDAMHAELASRGLTVAPPTVAFYGMKQAFVRDPDGYMLCFQSAANQPCTDANA